MVFIPAYSPHMGGLWEAGVKRSKFHLKRVLGNSHLMYEELNTIIIQVEACINSRPLCPLSDDPDSLTPLTPSHFLIGDVLTSIPERNLLEIKENRLSRFQRVQQLTQHLWRRWQKEYLAELQQRRQQQQQRGNLEINDLVIIKDDNLPPLRWSMGRVQEVHPGTDGVVRVVTLRTKGGLCKRAVRNLCVLPIE